LQPAEAAGVEDEDHEDAEHREHRGAASQLLHGVLCGREPCGIVGVMLPSAPTFSRL
jgi:hypothetical protein